MNFTELKMEIQQETVLCFTSTSRSTADRKDTEVHGFVLFAYQNLQVFVKTTFLSLSERA